MKRVLLVEPFGIGDALFVTPILRALKEEAGAAIVDILIGSRTREVFEKNPHVNEIFVVDLDKLRAQRWWRTVLDVFRLVASLRKRRYDLLIDCSLSRRYAFVGKVILRIPERIGFDYKARGIFLTRRVSIPQGYERKHVIEYHADLGRLAGLLVRHRKPDFFVGEEDDANVRSFLNVRGVAEHCRYVVVAPGGGESWGKDAHFKRWKPDFFSELLRRLSGKIDFDAVVVLGSRGESHLGEEIRQGMEKPVYNWSGLLSLRESACVLKRALLLLANDGGIVHMARALEIPVIALYGPVDEKIYGPYPPGPQFLALGRTGLECRPCYQRFRYNSACPHRECLTRFYPDEVMDRLLMEGFVEHWMSGEHGERNKTVSIR